MVVATPSGVTLAPEGGAHQSIATPLIGMSQDGLCAFEPAFVDELAVMMRWSFEYLQKDGEGDTDDAEVGLGEPPGEEDLRDEAADAGGDGVGDHPDRAAEDSDGVAAGGDGSRSGDGSRFGMVGRVVQRGQSSWRMGGRGRGEGAEREKGASGDRARQRGAEW